MTGISGMVCALVACVALTSCGGGDDTAATSDAKPAGDASSAATTSPAPEATPEVEPITMVEACPEVEAALPSAFIPGFNKMSAYVDRLNELSEQGDTETRNALELLTPEATALMLVIARNGQGSELTDVLGPHLDGVTAFAKRCKAAGSSALQ